MTVHQSDEWAIQSIDEIKKSYGWNDVEVAKFLGISRVMLSQIRAGTTRPPVSLKIKIADKTGYLATVDGVTTVLTSILGEEAGAKLKASILGLVKRPK